MQQTRATVLTRQTSAETRHLGIWLEKQQINNQSCSIIACQLKPNHPSVLIRNKAVGSGFYFFWRLIYKANGEAVPCDNSIPGLELSPPTLDVSIAGGSRIHCTTAPPPLSSIFKVYICLRASYWFIPQMPAMASAGVGCFPIASWELRTQSQAPPGAITWCLPGCTVTRSWMQEQTRNKPRCSDRTRRCLGHWLSY